MQIQVVAGTDRSDAKSLQDRVSQLLSELGNDHRKTVQARRTERTDWSTFWRCALRMVSAGSWCSIDPGCRSKRFWIGSHAA